MLKKKKTFSDEHIASHLRAIYAILYCNKLMTKDLFESITSSIYEVKNAKTKKT